MQHAVIMLSIIGACISLPTAQIQMFNLVLDLGTSFATAVTIQHVQVHQMKLTKVWGIGLFQTPAAEASSILDTALHLYKGNAFHAVS